MLEARLLPFGDTGHIEKLLCQLGALAAKGKEREFALILPTRQLLDLYRRRLVTSACRRLNLDTFDELAAAALAILPNKIKPLSAQAATEVMTDIVHKNADALQGLKGLNPPEIAEDLIYAIGQLRRELKTPADLAVGAQEDPALADLALLWRGYVGYLKANRLADIEEQYALAAGEAANIPRLQEIRQLHICWFSTFEPLQLAVIKGLCSLNADITLWLPFDHPAHEKHLAQTLGAIEEAGFFCRKQTAEGGSELAARLFTVAPIPVSTPSVKGLGAPRLKQELELVAEEIKTLVSQGAKAEEICIVIPPPGPYRQMLAKICAGAGIELSDARTEELDRIPWVRELVKTWRGASRSWERESLLQVSGNVYIVEHLPNYRSGQGLARALCTLPAGLRGKQWLTKLATEIERLSRLLAAGEEWRHKELKETLCHYEEAADAIKAWLNLGDRLAAKRSRQDHCKVMLELLQDNLERICPQEESALAIRDRLAWRQGTALLKDYSDCCRLLGRTERISAGQFLEETLPWLKRRFSLGPSRPGGVQVMSPSQIRGLRFPWVFIVGLNQGVFPQVVRKHWLLARASKEHNPSSLALAREKVYFHNAVAAAEKGLFLSRLLPGIEASAEDSVFWRETVAVAKNVVYKNLSSADFLPSLERATSATRLTSRIVYDLVRERQISIAREWLKGQRDYGFLYAASETVQRRESPLPPDDYDGALVTSRPLLKEKFGEGAYSISRLEQYGRCPFAFFLRYCLGLAPVPSEDDEYSPLIKGLLFHWLLERFYQDGHINEVSLEAPETIHGPLEKLAKKWLAKEGHGSEELIWKLRSREAVAQAAALIRVDINWRRQTGLKPFLFEASFGLPGSPIGRVTLGQGVSFHGRIDRVDVLELAHETWAVVYDYKTSKEVTRGQISAGKSLQVPVYLTAIKPLLEQYGFHNVRAVGGGYYILKTGKLAGGVWDQEFTRQVGSRLGSLSRQEFDELAATIAHTAHRQHCSILDGDFVPNPDGDACDRCDFVQCCRFDRYRFQLKEGRKNEAQS